MQQQQQQQRSSCDSCRRRKVKCDSAQPCQKCVENGLACTYGSTARRGLSTTYVRDLERQIAELQDQIQASTHGSSDLPSPLRRGTTVQQQHIDLVASAGDDLVVDYVKGSQVYRFSSALNILRMIADMLHLTPNPVLASSSAAPGRTIIQALDARLEAPSRDELEWLQTLFPPLEEIHQLADVALTWALLCNQCIDRDVLMRRIDHFHYGGGARDVASQKSFIAMLYAMLALGERYKAAGDGSEKKATLPGFQYFRASRCITNAEYQQCDLDLLTALVLQARYLHTLPNFTGAHAILSVAFSAAEHMGLHLDEATVHPSLSAEDLFARRRVFAVLCVMDTTLSYILGIPRALRFADAKQTLGLPPQDMLDEGERLLASDPTSPIAETVMAQKLLKLFARVIDRQSEGSEESWVDKEWVTEMERDLKSWEERLPVLPSEVSDSRLLLGQLQLRLYHTGLQILLYAPCIHHLGRHRSDPAFNIDGYTYGSACVSAATQAVLLSEVLQSHQMLLEASWVPSYLLTWAAVILTYFVMHSKTRVTVQDTLFAAMKANKMLDVLGQGNITNRRIHDCLEPYLEIAAGYDT